MLRRGKLIYGSMRASQNQYLSGNTGPKLGFYDRPSLVGQRALCRQEAAEIIRHIKQNGPPVCKPGARLSLPRD